jgi:hypothetical protein
MPALNRAIEPMMEVVPREFNGTMFLSVVTCTSRPAVSAAFSSSALTSLSHPASFAVVIV